MTRKTYRTPELEIYELIPAEPGWSALYSLYPGMLDSELTKTIHVPIAAWGFVGVPKELQLEYNLLPEEILPFVATPSGILTPAFLYTPLKFGKGYKYDGRLCDPTPDPDHFRRQPNGEVTISSPISTTTLEAE